MQAREMKIEISGLELCGRLWEPARPSDAVPTLALHGWLDNAASFDGLGSCFASSGRTLLALDLPGHGHSGHLPAGASYLFVDYVAVVANVLAALQWRRSILVGHSLGAGIVAMYAGASGARPTKTAGEGTEHALGWPKLEAIVLLEGMGPVSEPAEGAPSRIVRALDAEFRGRQRSSAPVYPDVEAVAARWKRTNPRVSDAGVRRLLERGLQPVSDGVTWRSDARLRDPSRMRWTEPHVMAFLQSIVVPTLAVKARDGFSMGAAVDEARAGAIRDLCVEEIDGGHHVHLDDPETVSALVLAFLERSPG